MYNLSYFRYFYNLYRYNILTNPLYLRQSDTSAQVHSFLHVLSHNYSEEKALQQIEIVVTFLRNGFNSLMEEALLRK